MAKKKKSGEKVVLVEPETRVEKELPAAFRIWEDATSIHCNIFWGREQASGGKLHKFSRMFPYPNPIPRGGGIFEEIIYIFKNLETEIYTTGSEIGGAKEYADYAQALKRIEDTAKYAIIVGEMYQGIKPDFTTVFSTIISFPKQMVRKT